MQTNNLLSKVILGFVVVFGCCVVATFVTLKWDDIRLIWNARKIKHAQSQSEVNEGLESMVDINSCYAASFIYDMFKVEGTSKDVKENYLMILARTKKNSLPYFLSVLEDEDYREFSVVAISSIVGKEASDCLRAIVKIICNRPNASEQNIKGTAALLVNIVDSENSQTLKYVKGEAGFDTDCEKVLVGFIKDKLTFK